MKKRMTLIERLRNPAWKSGGTWADATLETAQTRRTMEEAASTIQKLQKALTKAGTDKATKHD